MFLLMAPIVPAEDSAYKGIETTSKLCHVESFHEFNFDSLSTCSSFEYSIERGPLLVLVDSFYFV